MRGARPDIPASLRRLADIKQGYLASMRRALLAVLAAPALAPGCGGAEHETAPARIAARAGGSVSAGAVAQARARAGGGCGVRDRRTAAPPQAPETTARGRVGTPA